MHIKIDAEMDQGCPNIPFLLHNFITAIIQAKLSRHLKLINTSSPAVIITILATDGKKYEQDRYSKCGFRLHLPKKRRPQITALCLVNGAFDKAFSQTS
jgi:hypothetical protein